METVLETYSDDDGLPCRMTVEEARALHPRIDFGTDDIYVDI
jgi:hypothetical protein